MRFWGYHLMLDCAGCIPNTIRDRQTIHAFTDNLVRRIDMIPYGSPLIQHFGSGNKAGYTLVQLIETSNICAHFVEETDDMYLDVFSCKEFCPEEVAQVVRHYFGPDRMNTKFVVRQAPLKNELSILKNTELK